MWTAEEKTNWKLALALATVLLVLLLLNGLAHHGLRWYEWLMLVFIGLGFARYFTGWRILPRGK